MGTLPSSRRGKCVTLFGGVRGTPRNSSACKQQQGRYTNYCCNPYGKAAPISTCVGTVFHYRLHFAICSNVVSYNELIDGIMSPVVILISTFIVPKWVREKLLNSVELFISIGAHFVFFILTRPSKANKNFPYHVRTSQIGVMLQTHGSTPTGDNSIDKFAHHPYALTASNTTPNYVAIFGIQANGNHAPPTEGVTSGDFPIPKPTAPPIEEAIIRRS
ncbi:transmembrane protein 145 [Trichonephila clavipes]|nr:transmembrane protein 145 [Trichonephila clavipes]